MYCSKDRTMLVSKITYNNISRTIRYNNTVAAVPTLLVLTIPPAIGTDPHIFRRIVAIAFRKKTILRRRKIHYQNVTTTENFAQGWCSWRVIPGFGNLSKLFFSGRLRCFFGGVIIRILTEA